MSTGTAGAMNRIHETKNGHYVFIVLLFVVFGLGSVCAHQSFSAASISGKDSAERQLWIEVFKTALSIIAVSVIGLGVAVVAKIAEETRSNAQKERDVARQQAEKDRDLERQRLNEIAALQRDVLSRLTACYLSVKEQRRLLRAKAWDPDTDLVRREAFDTHMQALNRAELDLETVRYDIEQSFWAFRDATRLHESLLETMVNYLRDIVSVYEVGLRKLGASGATTLTDIDPGSVLKRFIDPKLKDLFDEGFVTHFKEARKICLDSLLVPLDLGTMDKERKARVVISSTQVGRTG